MLTVKQVSELTGLSVRTLHYYDSIGLLKPASVTEAGYRMYDDTSLSRLQSILLFRELQFPLKEIKEIIDSPDFDKQQAIAQQIKLLELKHRHIGELISFARKIQAKGVRNVDFKAFEENEFERYKSEVKAKWGKTEAYKQYEKKSACYSKTDYEKTAEEMMKIFAEFGELRTLPPDSEKVLQKVAALQNYISENFYTCTNDILKQLGKMYVCDERFKKNIDLSGGKGTAEFAGQAIKAYCNK